VAPFIFLLENERSKPVLIRYVNGLYWINPALVKVTFQLSVVLIPVIYTAS